MTTATLSPEQLATALLDEVRLTARHSNGLAGDHEEAHYHAGLVAWLRETRSDLFPVVEANYAGDRWRERADICLLANKDPAVWIELKRSWHREGYNNKPSDQLRSLLWDLAKLFHQIKQDRTQGLAVVLFYGDLAFAEESDLSGELDRSVIVDALGSWCQAYYDEEAKPERHWQVVREALRLPSNLQADRLLATYVEVLGAVGEVSVKPATDIDQKLVYTAVVGSVRA